MLYQAKCDSYGFNGRYWNKGDVDEFTAEQIKQMPKAYFNQLFEKVDTPDEQEGQIKGAAE